MTFRADVVAFQIDCQSKDVESKEFAARGGQAAIGVCGLHRVSDTGVTRELFRDGPFTHQLSEHGHTVGAAQPVLGAYTGCVQVCGEAPEFHGGPGSPAPEQFLREDFEEVTKEVPYTQFPGLLAASNSVDNAGDVLYHLGKNPSKMRELASSFQPVIDPYTGHQVANPMAAVAMKELRQLSESMRNNELAKEKGRPGEPLNQIRPSNVKTDSGSSSIKQLRSKWTV